MMMSEELRKKFLEFFIKRGHKQIPSASLIPENDPTTLFISAGMHPLVPYLLGEPHPLGKRLCSVQKCLRTGDIDSVGDSFHNTFFEMLGNWSLGDYWKEEMIPWSFEFLTKELQIPLEKISVTCFVGDKDAPKDDQTAKLWEKVGVPRSRIYFLGKEDNWWGPAGKTGPCGPDSEMFFDTGKEKCGINCRPGCSCGKYSEIWNDVFMQYEKRCKDAKPCTRRYGTKFQSYKEEYEFVPLKQKNIDTGMGVERTIAVLNGLDDVYRTDVFWPIVQKIEEISDKSYESEKNKRSMRIIADHLKAAVFIAADGVEPSNKQQGYVMRRLIRKAVVKMLQLGIISLKEIPKITQTAVNIYKKEYFYKDNFSVLPITVSIGTEIDNFLRTINKGTKLLQSEETIDGRLVFDLYQTYGFPVEITMELLEEWGRQFDKEKLKGEFDEELKKHQELSRTASAGMFRGGLADHSEMVTKYHTATHLLHAALRQVLGDHVHQVGSNITAERLRFDFTHPEKLTKEQINKVEQIVNEKIQSDLPVKMEIMSPQEARKRGALAFFAEKYGEKVKVYFIGDYSKEVCGGPHVSSTGQIERVKIIKEEAVGTGRRRIYARLA